MLGQGREGRGSDALEEGLGTGTRKVVLDPEYG